MHDCLIHLGTLHCYPLTCDMVLYPLPAQALLCHYS